MKRFFLGALFISFCSMHSAQLTPEVWDTSLFKPLSITSKKLVIGYAEAAEHVFRSCAQAVDKGTDAFLDAYNMLMQFYTQIANGGLVPFTEEYKRDMLPAFPSLTILPTFDKAWNKVQHLLPQDEQDIEKALKRATSRALRNKEYKKDIKDILLQQANELKCYVDYINKHYPELCSELKKEQEQMMAQMLKQMGQ